MEEEAKERVKRWVEEAVSRKYDLQDYKEEPFHWNDGRLAFIRYEPIDEEELPEVNIDFYEADKDGVGIIVWYPLTQKWVREVTEENEEDIKAIDREIEKIRKLARGGVKLPFSDRTLLWSILRSDAGAYYDDVGNEWRTDRLWLGVTVNYDRMPNQLEVNEAVEFLLADLTPEVVLAMLPPKIIEVVKRVEEIADGMWRP